MVDTQIQKLENIDYNIEGDLKFLLNKTLGELYSMSDTLNMRQKGFI